MLKNNYKINIKTCNNKKEMRNKIGLRECATVNKKKLINNVISTRQETERAE